MAASCKSAIFMCNVFSEMHPSFSTPTSTTKSSVISESEEEVFFPFTFFSQIKTQHASSYFSYTLRFVSVNFLLTLIATSSDTSW